MYYLADFKSDNRPSLFQQLKRTTSKVPGLNTQLSDLAKEKGQGIFRNTLGRKKPTLGQRVKMARGYLRYRKHLGDRYGKEKGMQMLTNQKNFVQNIVNPSYRQRPIQEVQ